MAYKLFPTQRAASSRIEISATWRDLKPQVSQDALSTHVCRSLSLLSVLVGVL